MLFVKTNIKAGEGCEDAMGAADEACHAAHEGAQGACDEAMKGAEQACEASMPPCGGPHGKNSDDM